MTTPAIILGLLILPLLLLAIASRVIGRKILSLHGPGPTNPLVDLRDAEEGHRSPSP